MKKTDLAARLARSSRISPAEAADRLDRVVHDILKHLKKGENASLPGLGTFKPGRVAKIRFEPASRKSAGPRRKA